MRTTLQRWGNSQGIRIPKGIADSLGISVGAELTVEISDDRTSITVTPSRDTRPVQSRYRIEDLIAVSAPGAFTGETDWGDSQGKEVW